MKFLKRFNLMTVVLLALTFTLGWQLGHRDVTLEWQNYHPSVNITDKTPPQEVKVDFKLFWDTWDLVSQKYYDKTKIDPNKLFYGAISGMVAAIGDPYTVFLPPDQQKATQEQLDGSFSGVGIELGYNKDKQLSVIAPLEGTPAFKAGIKPGDVIVKIDGKDSLNISLPEAVNQIRGPIGTQVVLTVFRNGNSNTKDIKLVRDTIVVKSVTVSYQNTPSNQKVAVVKLSSFGERTPSEWDSVVSDVLSSGSQAVVLDLRNNPGGYLDDAVYIASEFLQGGNVVLQEDYQKHRIPYPVNRTGKLLKLPLVVLINKGSASASEIVAGGLQDRKRATIVGQQSFGKGTIQETQNLPGGTGIHITTARWLTPNGRWVNDTQGLTPDVKVEEASSSAQFGNPNTDPELAKALAILN